MARERVVLFAEYAIRVLNLMLTTNNHKRDAVLCCKRGHRLFETKKKGGELSLGKHKDIWRVAAD